MARGRFMPPWWAVGLAPIFFLFLLAIGAPALSKLVKVPPEDTWLVPYIACFLFCSIVIAGLIGALVAKGLSSTHLADAVERCAQSVTDFKTAADQLTGELRGATQQFGNCPGAVSEMTRCAGILSQVVLKELGSTMVDYDGLKTIEGSVANGAEVWILTSALEIEDRFLADTIRENLKRGVKYRYIIPDNAELRRKMQNLATVWQRDANLTAAQAREQIQCIQVPLHFAYMTVCIYDPNKPTVLVKFPTSRDFPESKYKWIYRITDELPASKQSFVSALAELLDESSSSCPKRRPLTLNFT